MSTRQQYERTPLLESNIFEEPHYDPTHISSLRHIITASWIHVLLIFFPIGIIIKLTNAGGNESNDILTFCFNGLAIIPLASLLGLATEEITKRTNQTIGGLLNATFGNLVELMVSVIALKEGLIEVVQASLLGSILSNLLLVLGMAMFFGGLRYKIQKFNMMAAQVGASMMAISCVSIIIPAAFWSTERRIFTTLSPNDGNQKLANEVIAISRGISLILLVLYVMFLVFQLHTHKNLFEDDNSGDVHLNRNSIEDEDDDNAPHLTFLVAGLLLITATFMVSFSADYMVGSIETLTKRTGISSKFIGLIILPIVGNAAEHFTAVTAAMKNKMDLSLGVAMGSATQIALFVVPFTVIAGWAMNVPMTLEFSIFESAVLFISVFLVNGIVSDGSSNWLEGAMLEAVYLIVAISFWYA